MGVIDPRTGPASTYYSVLINTGFRLSDHAGTMVDAVLGRAVCVALLVCAGSSGEASAAIAINPSPLDVGDVLLGSSAQATGTLSSTDNVRVDLRVTTQCLGTGSGTFTLDKSQNINLGSPQQITVTYTPSRRGVRQCSVAVMDGKKTIGSFSVRGTGIAPATMSVSGSPDFGSVRWNNTAPVHTANRTFTVTNSGDVTLDITNVTVTGDFAITQGTTSTTILPNNSKSWTITFDPDAPGGSKSGTLTFYGNAPGNPSDAINLTGTATNAIISVNDQAFGIVNIGSSASADLTVTNTGTSPKGPLGVTTASISGGAGWFSFAGCGGGASCTFSPALSIATATVVGVRCSPPQTANAADTQTATVTFTSDTDDGTPDNVSTLTCTAGKSSLATATGTVNFAPQLVGTTSTPLSVTITNTGNVDATYYLERTGTNKDAFAVTTPTGCGTSSSNQCTVPANNGTSTVTVTVKPGFEGDVSAGLTLVSTATPSPQLTLSARGIDRHIQLADMLQFPDTFRNPGDMATIMPVTIKNIGEYPLHVSGLALDGEPNWQLVAETTAFDVPGLASHDVLVAFTPVAAGKVPDAMLAVSSDDRNNPLINIVLAGNGKDRNVAFGPGAIDFGNTGAGVPVTLTTIKPSEEWLTVLNEDEYEFEIRDIQTDMPDVFRVERLDGDSIGGMKLPAGARSQFEVVFLPPEVGEYTANMTLYLDQDPQGQRTVQLTGHALFVDAQGGGGFGCSAGGDGGGGIVVLGALGALIRRKRRRA